MFWCGWLLMCSTNRSSFQLTHVQPVTQAPLLFTQEYSTDDTDPWDVSVACLRHPGTKGWKVCKALITCG
jgi:hypothetical protein